MTEKSVIIIGAGLAGLSAGCYAQLGGYRARIFEHHTAPGGVAACWRRGKYLIDGGIHFMMGNKEGSPVFDMYKDLGVAGATRFLPMGTYGRFVDEAGGRELVVTGDLDRLEADLIARHPSDAKAIASLISDVRKLTDMDMLSSSMGEPPELMGPWEQLKMMWGMRGLLRYFTGRYKRPVSEYTRGLSDPELRYLLDNLFLPEVPLWFILMLLGMLAGGQMALLEGGSESLVRPIERRFTSLGGEVVYGARVERVIVESDNAAGIRLADGTEHRADRVISAADGRGTIYGMLGGRYVDKAIEGRYRDWRTVKPLLMASFGVAREFKGEPHFTMYKLKEPLAVGKDRVRALSVRLFNYSGAFAPPGRTVVQAMFDTDWDHWAALREDRAAYDLAKEQVASDIVSRLEAHYPGITGQVELTDVVTPHTMWRYTLNDRGAYMGWLPPAEEMLKSMPRALPGLRGFYMAGQWSTPGGSALTSLYSGKQAVQVMAYDDGLPTMGIGR